MLYYNVPFVIGYLVYLLPTAVPVNFMAMFSCPYRYPNFGASCHMSSYKWWTGVVMDTFKTCGFEDKEVIAKVARELYYYYANDTAWELLPGASEALQELQKYDVKMGVISNFDHRLYKVLNDMNLRHYFDFVLPSYVVGAEKPDPLIFQRALQDAGCSAQEAVHFGDNVQKDFIGARDAGWVAYLLETKGVNHDFLEDKYVVSTVGEFVSAITPHLRKRSEAST
jgi:REG-2-like HAD superfamily hydrolase